MYIASQPIADCDMDHGSTVHALHTIKIESWLHNWDNAHRFYPLNIGTSLSESTANWYSDQLLVPFHLTLLLGVVDHKAHDFMDTNIVPCISK